jgi:transposase
MILEAREVRLRRGDRQKLEARCRSPLIIQRDLKRARIVLLAAQGRSTRSIAREVGVQPRIVSLWRARYADHGLQGLDDKPRPGKAPIYTEATTGKRILKLLDRSPPAGFGRWTGPLLAGELSIRFELRPPFRVQSRPLCGEGFAVDEVVRRDNRDETGVRSCGVGRAQPDRRCRTSRGAFPWVAAVAVW